MAIVTFFLAACAGHTAVDPWAKVQTPAPVPRHGRAESIGQVAAGCLLGGVSLPPDGPGYQVMRLERDRFYGTPELVAFIKRLARKVKRHHLGTLLIGDMAQPRGGPTMSSHASHQSGIDVDIWFWLDPVASRRPLRLDERATLSAPSMVMADGKLNPKYWSVKQARILKLAAQDPRVDRIFVNPVIKRWLCARKGPKAWLYKIHPWWGHKDHFHVRLFCPVGDSTCIQQKPVPPGDGCGKGLAWWFSDEAKAETAKAESVHLTMPKLPAACSKVLKEQGI